MAPVVHRLRVRYNECDAQGHVFNANYFTYFDVALTELWRETLGSYEALTAEGLDLVVAETGARFHAPARFDDELEIALEVERLGEKAPIPDYVRRVLLPYTVEDPDSPARSPITES